MYTLEDESVVTAYIDSIPVDPTRATHWTLPFVSYLTKKPSVLPEFPSVVPNAVPLALNAVVGPVPAIPPTYTFPDESVVIPYPTSFDDEATLATH